MTLLRTALLLGLIASIPSASAQSLASFLGEWMTYDSETEAPEAVVRIAEDGDEVVVRIDRILPPPGARGYGCDGCHARYAGRDVRQLDLVRGLTFRRRALRGGRLVDFETGETYRCRISMSDDGHLRVRIYEGVPLNGVTDIWTRVR